MSSVLPGELGVDEALVDTAVARLNELWVTKTLEAALELGRVVLELFFDGDPSNFRHRSNRHASFRALAQRGDLQVRYLTLWRAVRVVEQLPALPPPVQRALPLSHHALLLAVHDEPRKAELAQRAHDERWSKRDLAEEIARSRSSNTGNKRGRKPLPRFEKTVNKLVKLVERPEAFGDLQALEGLDAARAAALREGVARVKAHLDTLAEKIGIRSG